MRSDSHSPACSASGLLNHTGMAEDIVHDVFLQRLAQAPGKLRLAGNLRSFLATCVVNRAGNANRALRQRRTGVFHGPYSFPREIAFSSSWPSKARSRPHSNIVWHIQKILQCSLAITRLLVRSLIANSFQLPIDFDHTTGDKRALRSPAELSLSQAHL